jgi:hypothetical protein
MSSGTGGSQQTSLLLSGAEVVAVDDTARGDAQRITLRVAQSQAASVIRADVFARELRAIAWP